VRPSNSLSCSGTRRTDSARYGRPITDEEAQQLIDSMVAFAEIVIEWCLEDQKKDKSPEDPSDAR
jgi:hypothetical protein